MLGRRINSMHSECMPSYEISECRKRKEWNKKVSRN